MHLDRRALVACLNGLLKHRLTAIHQHFLHARMLKHRRDLASADFEYKASIEAMRHADMLVEHILALGGLPCLQELGSLRIGGNAEEMLLGDLALAKQEKADIEALMDRCGGAEKKTRALLDKMGACQNEIIACIHRTLHSAEAPPPSSVMLESA